ncbi:PREDICTED: uncharacterized protein LOC106321621, partial [Brassica oleracea var. oleracea]|uniref:uncharacterized protein LOC106321621 n=1 Tax=Brassica oleracea var. oleracea TaxID=109376 RepID=UPI0006A73B1A
MWGKGKRLEIHNNPLNRSAIVRIQSDYLRSKILEKCIWYVGDSMFHTAQWSSDHSMSTPPLKAIKIWAHLTGVPLDLRYDEGLSLVAGLVGEPKETDDFTKNLVSLTVSHVKVEVDLTKPLPDVVEFERQNGEVVEVMVHYPWVPPTCSHCHELGHIIKNCLHYTPPPKAAPEPPSGAKKQDVKRQRKYQPKAKLSEQGSAVTPSPTPTVFPPDLVSHFEAALPVSKLAPSVAIVADTMSPLPASSSLVRSSSNASPVFSSPDPPPRPSLKSLTCLLALPNSRPVYYTAVYASNLSSERVDLLADLINLHSMLNLDGNPWILGGDFNQIISPIEHSSMDVNTTDNLMYQLRDCFLQLGVFDLWYLGPQHTWTNNRPEDPIAKKLDRLLVNSSMVASLPHALATYLPPLISDHTPCLIDLAYQLPQAGTKPFKLQNYLTKHPSFAQHVYDAWLRAGSECLTLTQLCWKLKVIKRDLKQLNRENYSKIQERVSETYSLLQHVQVQALQNPSTTTFEAERDLHQRWLFLREIEESYFRQKSRIN